MIVGHFPFKGPDDKTLFAKIQKGAFSIPENLSLRCQSMFRKILHLDPDLRLTAN